MTFSISETSAAIRAGKMRPSQLVTQCLDRIDCTEPTLHAWVRVDRAGAMRAAALLEHELDARRPVIRHSTRPGATADSPQCPYRAVRWTACPSRCNSSHAMDRTKSCCASRKNLPNILAVRSEAAVQTMIARAPAKTRASVRRNDPWPFDHGRSGLRPCG